MDADASIGEAGDADDSDSFLTGEGAVSVLGAEEDELAVVFTTR